MEIAYSSGHCSMQLRMKNLEDVSVGAAEKELCATVFVLKETSITVRRTHWFGIVPTTNLFCV